MLCPRSSAWIEHLPSKQRVAGSNPVGGIRAHRTTTKDFKIFHLIISMFDLKTIEEKWNKKWYESGEFEAEPDERKKYFVNFPYPYMNGYLHLGHLYTLMRVEVMARYKRLRGYNVLFPFSYHCTGTPIIAAAERIKNGEEKEWNIMRMMGIPEEEIKKFSDPVYWTEYFPEETKKDLMALGLAVDFRRSFITTSLNPRYSKFIEWQFRHLKEKGYVVQGEHPVVWCPNCKSPVGDHARLKGEGVRPEKMVLLKFYFEDFVLPAATYRPETIFGVTNMWINPDVEYVKAKVDGENWIISKDMVEKLRDQKHDVNTIGTIRGVELVGKKCKNPVNGDMVPILPASFVDPSVGSGIVMSVPAHAPYDYVALEDVKRHPEGYGVKKELVEDIKPISLIKLDGFGEFPAVEISKRMDIKDQGDEEKLEAATKEIYKKEFHTGVLKEITGKYKGMLVREAKDIIIEDFKKDGIAVEFWELPEEVICRCLTKTHVKIVDDQWFLKYSDPEWKKQAHKALEKMNLYPEIVRKQFDYVIDWLNDWACTREFGLGTPLPWDKKWVIESLSDSTIYMAFYTIWHILKEIPVEKIDDELFDYIFLGKGDEKKLVEKGIEKDKIEKMKKEFDYWYPFDMRNSGKDLIQNHLSFCIFNHVAIFPEDKWPRAFGLNGHVLIDGEKMSKSKGNFRTIRGAVKEFGVSPLRLAIAMAGEGVDDANFETEFAKSLKGKIENWMRFSVENYGKGDSTKTIQDEWFENKLNEIINETTELMENMMFKSALSKGFFELQNAAKFYVKWRNGFNAELMKRFIESQTAILEPFIPHISAEISEELGFKLKWPNGGEVNKKYDLYQKFIDNVINDIKSVKKLAQGERVKIFVAEKWKFQVLKEKDVKSFLEKHIDKSEFGFAMKMIKKLRGVEILEKGEELKILKDSKDFIEKECGVEVEVLDADECEEEKARMSTPTKPGLLLW